MSPRVIWPPGRRWLLGPIIAIVMVESLVAALAGTINWALRSFALFATQSEFNALYEFHVRLAVMLWAWTAVHVLVLIAAAIRTWGSGWLLALAAIEVVDFGIFVVVLFQVWPESFVDMPSGDAMNLAWTLGLGLLPVAALFLLALARMRLQASASSPRYRR